MNKFETRKNISVKKATIKDIYSIVRIHRKCVLYTNAKFYPKKSIKKWLNQISEKNTINQFKNSSWFVLKINNRIIGFCQFSLKNKTLYQINIYPKYQNKGFGIKLYNFIENYFKKYNKRKISLNSTLNAEKFYKTLGFKKLRKIKFKIDNIDIPMIKMEKKFLR